jgi:hypothetical protein
MTLFVTALSARSARLGRVFVFALVWILAASAPAVLFLSNAYVDGSPRLFYLVYVGVALLWSLPFAALSRLSIRPVWSALAQLALLALIVVPPSQFTRCQLDLYGDATGLVRQVAALSAESPDDARPAFVNLPVFFGASPSRPQGCPTPYPWTNSGAIVYPSYADLRDFNWLNGGDRRATAGMSVVALDAVWPPRYGAVMDLSSLRQLLTGRTVYIFDDKTWTFFPLSEIWITASTPAPEFKALLGQELGLHQVSMQLQDRDLQVTSKWRTLAPSRPLTSFVHVYDQAGKLVAQSDAPLGKSGGRLLYAPFELRQEGDVIVDRHRITLPGDLGPGSYSVAIGVYDPATIVRLAARDASGQPLANDLVDAGQIILP